MTTTYISRDFRNELDRKIINVVAKNNSKKYKDYNSRNQSYSL